MLLLSIGYSSDKCGLYHRLSELSMYFKNQNINIALMESDSKSYHFVKFIIRDEDINKLNIDETRLNFNVYAANVLHDIIVDNYQIENLKKIVKDKYYYFRDDEAESIINRCADILKGVNLKSNEDYLYYINRKNDIVGKIFEYLKDNTEFIIEGFATFRLKGHNEELENLVEKVVEEFLIEREYDEFIKLLRYFVEIQDCKIDVVNIVIGKDGSYCIYDEKNREITEELLKELFGDALSNEKNCDDLLVSSLITAAPRHIVIHNVDNVKNKEITETIKNVFDNKVTECTGCKLCVKQNPVHKF